MSKKEIDYLILGPLPPFRGGIAETQWEFANALQQKGYNIECWSFSKLYPFFMFPGKSQFTLDSSSLPFLSERNLHAYSPFIWLQLAKRIHENKPKRIVFRYWTPFLAPLYGTLARLLPKSLPKIVLVDNWVPHEKRKIDAALNAYLSNHITHFTTLSKNVADQIPLKEEQKLWWGFHPLPTQSPKKISTQKARESLHMDQSKPQLLFFGLIRPYKGLDLLLKACAKIPSTIQLHIVGEFYTDKTPYLKLIQENQLQERVHLVDRFVSSEEVTHYFSAVDAVVLPYKSATQSGVIAQAYQYETPLVVTDQPGLAKAVEDHKTGQVCKATPDALAKSIVSVLTKEAQKKYRAHLKNSKINYQWSAFIDQWTHFVERN